MTNAVVALHSPLNRLGTWPNLLFLHMIRQVGCLTVGRFSCVLDAGGWPGWLRCGGSVAFSIRSSRVSGSAAVVSLHSQPSRVATWPDCVACQHSPLGQLPNWTVCLHSSLSRLTCLNAYIICKATKYI